MYAALQAVPDTLVTVPLRDGLSMAADGAMLAMAAALVVLAALLLSMMRDMHKSMRRAHKAFEKNLGPVSERTVAIADNVEFITGALRTDVARLNASVKALTDRLHQASDRMEERIEEFNALMEVVQTEAEEIFIDTAATVRGVKEGARAAINPARRRLAREDETAADPDADEPGERPELPPRTAYGRRPTDDDPEGGSAASSEAAADAEGMDEAGAGASSRQTPGRTE
ncbi:MAG: hypothetical protein RH859_00755 [Longimicrobiales bacterium]